MNKNLNRICGVDFEGLMAPFGPFEENPHIAIAVSGGADSLALTLLAHEWAKALGGKITALTVDHGLRSESAEEARLVGVWLTRHGIEHHTLPWSGLKPKTGIQDAARTARYQIMACWCQQAGVLHLLTAHHRDDQIETYLMRLQQGSGPDGLSGMSAVQALKGCLLIRPFLPLPAHAPKKYLQERGQDWIEDPSNHDERFTRIRIRQGIAESELDTDKIAKEILGFGSERILKEQEVTKLLARFVSLHPSGFAWIDNSMFDHALDDVLLKCLSRLVTVIGGLEYPPRRLYVERLYKQFMTKKIMKAVKPEKIAATFGRCRFVDYGNRVLICRELRNLPEPIPVSGLEAIYWDKRYQCRFKKYPQNYYEGGTKPRENEDRVLMPLGDKGWKEIASKVEDCIKNDIPDPVRRTFPALFDDQGVFSVPFLDYKRDRKIMDSGVEFVEHSFSPSNNLSGSRFNSCEIDLDDYVSK